MRVLVKLSMTVVFVCACTLPDVVVHEERSAATSVSAKKSASPPAEPEGDSDAGEESQVNAASKTQTPPADAGVAGRAAPTQAGAGGDLSAAASGGRASIERADSGVAGGSAGLDAGATGGASAPPEAGR